MAHQVLAKIQARQTDYKTPQFKEAPMANYFRQIQSQSKRRVRTCIVLINVYERGQEFGVVLL